MPSYSRRPGSARPAPIRADTSSGDGLAASASGAKSFSCTRKAETKNATGTVGTASRKATEPASIDISPHCSDQGACARSVAAGATDCVLATCQRSNIQRPCASRSTPARGCVKAILPTVMLRRAKLTWASSIRSFFNSASEAAPRMATPGAAAGRQLAGAVQVSATPSSVKCATCATTAAPCQATPPSAVTVAASCGVSHWRKYGATSAKDSACTELATWPCCSLAEPLNNTRAGADANVDTGVVMSIPPENCIG